MEKNFDLKSVVVISMPFVLGVATFAHANPLTQAVKSGDLAKVESILKADHAAVNLPDENGEIPLQHAFSRPELIEVLLKSGADVCTKTNIKEQPETVVETLRRVRTHPSMDQSKRDAYDLTLEILESQQCGGKYNDKAVSKIKTKRDAAQTDKRLPPGKFENCPALYQAAAKGDAGAVQQLLSKGASVSESCGGFSTLQAAIPSDLSALRLVFKDANHEQVVELLLSKGADPNLKSAKRGLTPMHLAAESGATKTVEKLIAKGAHIESRTDLGETPLFLAAKNGHWEVVNLLLKNGAYVNARNVEGMTPLFAAARAMPRSLHDQTEKAELTESYLKVLHVLLERSANATEQDGFSELTHLTLASMTGDVAIVRRLIKDGANVKARVKELPDWMEYTPLHFAAAGGYDEIVRLLLKNGADFNAQTTEEWTPLILTAAQFKIKPGHFKVVEELVKAGANINFATKRGLRAIHSAPSSGNAKYVELFIKKGANVNVATDKGLTPLHISVIYWNYPEVVRALVRGGADVNAMDKTYNKSPLEMAIQLNKIALVEVMKSASKK